MPTSSQSGGCGFGRCQRRRTPCTPGREQAVAEQKGRTAELGDVDDARVGADQRTEPRDAGRDQHDVGDGADGHDGQDVLAADALT